MRRPNCLFLLLAVLSMAASSPAFATNGSATYAGGSFTTGAAAGQSITVASASLVNPKGTLSFSCPITAYTASTYSLNWTCSGGSVTVTSVDHSLAFSGTFLSGSMTFTSSGGGKGGHVADLYEFTGSFSGTVSAGAVTQLVYGSVTQSVDTSKSIGSGSAAVSAGSFGWNSAYSPLLVADAVNSRVLVADNIAGANLSATGSAGTGVDQFGTVAGLAEDATSHIYATDSVLDRVVRVNSSGGSWTSLGSAGGGTDHFSSPHGIAVDASGKIWVADTGNNRIVRFDDMTGANWTAFGTLGSGADHFNAPAAIAFDARNRIYVADTGNNRLVRFDNISGLNWTTLTQATIGTLSYPFSGPSSIAINTAGQVYVALVTGYLVRVDNIAGANPAASYWGGALKAVSIDKAGTIYVAGNFTPGLAQIVDASAAGYFASALGNVNLQVSALLAISLTQPPPAQPALSTNALAFGSRNVGTPTAAQSITIANIGAAPLTFKSLYTPADYKGTTKCALTLAAGASCSGALLFQPIATGHRNATLTIATSGVRSVVQLALTGTGTKPQPVLLPASVSFDPQPLSTLNGTQAVTLTNTGSGPLAIKSVTASPGFVQSSNCVGVVTAGNGCTLQISFKPTAAGIQTGSVTIADDAVAGGTQQLIPLTGTGVKGSPTFTLSPESLQFPDEKLNSTSAAQTITLTNTSTAKIGLSAPTYPAAFSGTSTCGSSLANGASCTYSITFKPTAAGPVSESLLLPIAGSTLHAGLAGTGVAAGRSAVLSSSPSTLAFGSITIGDNPTLTATVTNLSGLPAGITSVTLTGASTFSITGNTCSGVVAGETACTIGVTFLPLSTSNYTNVGTLTITEGSGAITQVSISGYAVSASAALTY